MRWRSSKSLGCKVLTVLLAMGVWRASGVLDRKALAQPTELNGIVSTFLHAQEWQTYTVKGEEFSVNLPVLPAMTTQKIQRMHRPRRQTEREIGAYWNGVAYVIRTVENTSNQSLDDFVKKRYVFHSRQPTDIALGVFRGKEVSFDTQGVSGASQFFRTKKHLYEFSALGGSIGDPRVAPFFLSITLGDETRGIELEDGIGHVVTANNVAEGEQPFVGKDVNRKVVLAMKPTPSYTERARMGQITGTVVLKAIFASDGTVKGIRVVSGLPSGLTEQATIAARKIKFIPAVKDGRFVSMWLQLEYNFNLY